MLRPDAGRPSPKDSGRTVNPLEAIALPRQFKTSKGSVYTYGDDARVTRFKTATGEKFDPSDICVFMDASNPYFEAAIGASLHLENFAFTLFLTESAADGSVSYPIRWTDIKDPAKLEVQIWADGEGDPTLKFTKPAQLTPKVGLSPLEFDVVSNDTSQETALPVHIGHPVTEIVV